MSPTASGRLTSTSLAELLALALERRVSGSFVFTSAARRESVLVLATGRVVKAKPGEPAEPLGRVLAELHPLAPEALARALELARERGVLLGEALLAQGALDRPCLERGLHEQLGRRLALLAGLPEESAFAFYADVDLLDDQPGCDADPLALIWRCACAGGPLGPRQRARLGELGERPLMLRERSALGRLGLSASERAWLEVLRAGARPLEALLATGTALERAAAERIVHGLLVTRQLLVEGRTGSAASEAPRADTAPPRVPSRPSAPATRAAPGASSDPREGARAPWRSPLSAPPQRLTSSEAPGASRRSLAPERVEHALERASRLVRERARAEGAADAARAIADARACIARKQFREAEQLARRACAREPNNPEHLALHAWLRMQSGELGTPALAAQILSALSRAVLEAPGNVGIRLYRAEALKRLGRDEEAYRDFRFVARHAPEHLDAQREVRLHEMRARKKPSAPRLSGVFSKLFSS